jgi:ABC-type lipoprotein export system ATPase subunit
MASGFGCMMVGPAGSGKSTLCHAIQEVAEQ